MNRNRYRLIFDKRTGTLVPVAEFTTAAKKGSGGGQGEAMGETATPRWRRLAAMVAMGMGLPLALQAQTVVDPSSNATLTNTANGVPLYNIENPNGSGLSHNKASEFHVGRDGMVFNNSLQDGVSAIGGYTMKNPHLAREANGILVEVTGANRSRLEGAMEVFGGKADLLIANQNGLYVNGVSTINVDGLTLTTGAPTGGRSFDIHGGLIEVQGAGLSTEGLSHADLVARSMQLHGALSGSDDASLRVVAGLNTFDAATGEVTVRQDAAPLSDETPAFAIDGSAVAMHGRHILMVSTESGLGVRHEGAVSSVGDIEISVDGDLRLRGLKSGGDATLAASHVSLGGADGPRDLSTQVDGTLQVDARGDLLLAGNHQAQTIALDVDGTLLSNGSVQAVQRTVGADASIDVRAGAVTLTGAANWQAASTARLSADAILLAEGAKLVATDVALGTTGTLDNAATITANDTLAIDAHLLANRGKLTGKTTFVDAQRLDNSGVVQASTDLHLVLGAGTSTNTGKLTALDVLTLHGAQATLDNRGDLSGDAVLIDLEAMANHADAIVWARDAALRLARLDNAGTIFAGTLDLTADWLRNAGPSASLYAMEAARLAVARDLENTAGATLASNHLTIDVDGNLRNGDGGTIGAVGMAVRVAGDLDNADGALIEGNVVDIDAEGAVRNDGEVYGYQSLVLEADTLDNAGLLSAYDAQLTTAGALANHDGGVIHAERFLDAKVGGDFVNTGDGSEVVGAVVDIEVDGNAVNLDGAVIEASHALSLKAATIANRNARILAASGLVDQAGNPISSVSLATTHGDLVNEGTIVAEGTLWIDAAGNLHNGADGVIAGFDLGIAAAGDVTNDETASIEAVRLAQLDIDGSLVNDGLLSAHGVLIEADTAIRNTGEIVGGGWIEADTTALDNAGGRIEAKDEVFLSTETFRNSGKVHADGYTTLTIEKRLDLVIDESTLGTGLTANGALTLNAENVWIDEELANPGHIVINAEGDIDNLGGILTGKSLYATAGGEQQYDGDVTHIGGKPGRKGDFINRSLVWAAGDVHITADNLVNQAGAQIEATKDLSLDVDATLVNAAGARITAGGNAWIDAQDLRNEVLYTGDGVIQVGEERGRGVHYDSRNQYELLMGREYWDCGGSCREDHGAGLPTFGSNLVVTAQGRIEAGGDLRINQGRKHNQEAAVFNQGLIQAGGHVLINGDVDNVGIAASESIEDVLKRATYFHMRVESSLAGAHASEYYDSLWDMLDDIFSASWRRNMNLAGQYIHADQFAETLKTMIHPQLNALVSLVLKADWKNVEYDTLVTRWNAFKANVANEPAIQALANRGPEITAGGTVLQDGGHFRNTSGATYHENRTVTVQIGEEEVETIDGNFDVLTNLRDLAQALDPREALDALTDGNQKFRPAQAPPSAPPIDWAQVPPVTGPVAPGAPPVPVHPVYETRIAFVDQGAFYGSQYFFDQIGFRSDRTVTVVGDNYFINELVTTQIASTVGGFFAAEYGVVGADLVRFLMDNAGVEGPRLGLQLGIAPTPAQLAQLDRDIVWFVELEVDGFTTLVPQTFLSARTVAAVQADRAAGGATVAAGQDVLVDADEGGVRNHNATIRAKRDVDIQSKGDVDNIGDNGLEGGGIQAGGNLIVEAKGELVPMTMEEVLARGAHETIIAVPLTMEEVMAAGPYDVVPRVDEESGIIYIDDVPQTRIEREAKELRVDDATGIVYVDGEPQMRGTASVNNIGGTLQGKNVLVDTTGDFTDQVRMGHDKDGSLVVGQQSQIRGDNSVTVKAKGDIDMAASKVEADHVRLISEDGNVRIRDVHEVSSSHTSQQQVFGQGLSKMTTNTTSAKATSVGSSIRGAAEGGSLVIQAKKGNVELTGGEYGADSGFIQAGGDVTMKTGRDYTYEKTHVVAEGFTAGGRVGALGAGAAGEAGPMGTSTAVDKSGFENPDAADGKSQSGLNSGKAVLGESVGGNVGYQKTEITETHSTIKNKNAQLDFGSSIYVDAGNTVDIGGADISAKTGDGEDRVLGDVVISGKEIKSTKYLDEEHRTYEKTDTFVGITASGQSSLADAANNSKKLADKTKEGMRVDGAGTAGQAVGDASNLVFNDLAGGQANFAVQHSSEKSSSSTTSENMNTVIGNIRMTSTVGNIELAGVMLDGAGGSVVLDSARNLTMRSAETTYEGASSSQSHQATVGGSASVAPTGAGVGVSAGYNGARSESQYSGTSHTNSGVVGNNVLLKSNGDTTFQGVNVVAGQVDLDIGGNFDLRSVQDTYTSSSNRQSWGASAGGSVNSQTGVSPTGSVDVGGGRSWENSALTGQQSGIKAGTINGRVGGDFTQQGSHLVAEDGGNLDVAGRHISEELRDRHEADGFFVGAGGGVGENGLGSVNVQVERDDRIDYESQQNNTVSGVNVNAKGGTQGTFNTDVDNMETVLKDDKVAGNSISVTLGIDDIRERIPTRRPQATGSGSADFSSLDDATPPSRQPSLPSAGEVSPPTGATPRVELPDTVARAPRDAAPPVRLEVPAPDYDTSDHASAPPRDGGGPITFERGARLADGVGRIVPEDRVQDMGDGLVLMRDKDGHLTNRYVEKEIGADGTERYRESGMVTKVNERPATRGDLDTFFETHNVERPTSIFVDTMLPSANDRAPLVVPKPDYPVAVAIPDDSTDAAALPANAAPRRDDTPNADSTYEVAIPANPAPRIDDDGVSRADRPATTYDENNYATIRDIGLGAADGSTRLADEPASQSPSLPPRGPRADRPVTTYDEDNYATIGDFPSAGGDAAYDTGRFGAGTPERADASPSGPESDYRTALPVRESATAPSGDAVDSRIDDAPVDAPTPDDTQKQGHLYLPKVGDDSASAVAKHAASRLLEGKDPVPVILRNAKDVAAFDKALSTLRNRVERDLKHPKLDPAFRERKQALLAATMPGRIPVANDADDGVLRTLDPERSKLYVVGHGESGLDGIAYLRNGESRTLGSNDIAKQLAEAGLAADHRDIRLFTCQGACPAEDGGPSSGQQLADALGEAGFANVEVAAYPGSIGLLGERLEDGHFHRTVRRPEQDRVQASTLRETFRPDPGRMLADAFLGAAKQENATLSRFRSSALEPLAAALRKGDDIEHVLAQFDALPKRTQAKYPNARDVLRKAVEAANPVREQTQP